MQVQEKKKATATETPVTQAQQAQQTTSVKVGLLGRDPLVVTLPAAEATLSAVMKAVRDHGVDLSRLNIRVNGRELKEKTVLVDGDIVTMLPQMRGGRS